MAVKVVWFNPVTCEAELRNERVQSWTCTGSCWQRTTLPPRPHVELRVDLHVHVVSLDYVSKETRYGVSNERKARNVTNFSLEVSSLRNLAPERCKLYTRNVRRSWSVKIKMSSGSRIFAGFRALGFVSNEVPCCVQTSRDNYFVSTAIGRSFHIYNVGPGSNSFLSHTCMRVWYPPLEFKRDEI